MQPPAATVLPVLRVRVDLAWDAVLLEAARIERTPATPHQCFMFRVLGEPEQTAKVQVHLNAHVQTLKFCMQSKTDEAMDMFWQAYALYAVFMGQLRVEPAATLPSLPEVLGSQTALDRVRYFALQMMASVSDYEVALDDFKEHSEPNVLAEQWFRPGSDMEVAERLMSAAFASSDVSVLCKMRLCAAGLRGHVKACLRAGFLVLAQTQTVALHHDVAYRELCGLMATRSTATWRNDDVVDASATADDTGTFAQASNWLLMLREAFSLVDLPDSVAVTSLLKHWRDAA